MQQSGVLRVAHPHRHGGIVILSIALLFSILLNDLVHQGQPLLWRIDHVQRLFHLLFADAFVQAVVGIGINTVRTLYRMGNRQRDQ